MHFASQSPSEHRQLLHARACGLYRSGRYWEASTIFSRLRESRFQHPQFSRWFGWCHLALGDRNAAEAAMHEAVVAAPNDWESYFALGEVIRLRDPHEATTHFVAALERSPENLHCLLSMSACQLATGHPALAELTVRRALKVTPADRSAWTNLGFALEMQGRLSEAHDAFAEAERLDGLGAGEDDEELNRGRILRLMGRTEEAIAYYESNLRDHPSASAHADYALALLTSGRFAEGWDQYEFRWMDLALAAQRARYDRPAWDGHDVRGRTVLLRCEQGFGDVFQFIRYAPRVKAWGARVLLELRPGLGSLANGFPGIDRWFPHGEVSEPFDFYIDLASLPRVFGTVLDSIPGDVPYISTIPERRPFWRERFAAIAGLKVGLCWAGDPAHPRDRQRSVPRAMFASVAEFDNVHWFSLQKGPARNIVGDSRPCDRIVDLIDDLHEFADTAAVIEHLDLVVSVDTSIAHLAGALGKEVWVLLPFSADWRWLEDREDSPWYPTMRLFRQSEPDNWQDVVDRVRMAIRELLRMRRPVDAPQTTIEKKEPQPSGVARLVHASGGAHGLAKVCRTRFGTIQYVGGDERIARSVQYYGEYLQPYLDILSKLVKPGDVVAELGSGIGLHAIAVAQFVGSEGHVLAFEKCRSLRRIMRENCATNAVRGISVMPSTMVDSSIDDLQLEHLDLLKVNDPDRAHSAVSGGAGVLWRDRPILFLAHDSVRTLDNLAQDVADFGYRCWSVQSPIYNASNFNLRHDDIFGGESALALLAIPEEMALCPATHHAIDIRQIG